MYGQGSGFDWRQAMGGGPPQFTLGYDYGAPSNPFGGAPNTGSPVISQPITSYADGQAYAGQPYGGYPEEEDEGSFLGRAAGAIGDFAGDFAGGVGNLIRNNPETLAQLIGTGLAYKGARDDRRDERQDRQRVLRERAQSGQNIGQLIARGFKG